MTRYLVVSIVAFLVTLAPAWSDGTAPEAGRYQVFPDAQVPDRTGKLRAQTILLDSVTGRTWTLAPNAGSPGAGSPGAGRATWMPIPVQGFGGQEALATPGSDATGARRQESRTQEERQSEGYRERLWNYERDP